MGTVVDLAALAAFIGLLAGAVVTDVRNRRIPNLIPAAIVALYPLHVLSGHGDPFRDAVVALIVLAAGAALFAARIIGGGDVKLLAATSLWAGPTLVLSLIFVTALAGGIVAAGLLVRQAIGKRRGEASQPAVVPYAMAIAAGGVLVAARLAGA